MSALDKLCTPPDVLELVRKVGPIGVDVFPGEHALVNPRVKLPTDWDAYKSTDWTRDADCGEVVWVQPPYSRGHLPRVASIWAGLRCNPYGENCHAIALLPAATGTNWFQIMANSSNATTDYKTMLPRESVH